MPTEWPTRRKPRLTAQQIVARYGQEGRPRRRKTRYPSYKAYLASPLWKWLRRQAISGARHICKCCRKRPVQHVHHKQYPRDWRDDHIGNLVPLCGSCHRRIHGIKLAESVPSTTVDDPQTTPPLCDAKAPTGSTPPSTYDHEEKALDRSPESQ